MTEPRDTTDQEPRHAADGSGPAAGSPPPAVTDGPAGLPADSEPGAAPRTPPSRPPSARRRPRSGPAQVQGILLFGFGLIEILILLRIALIMLDARRDDAIVNGILETSEILVAPFAGILQSSTVLVDSVVIDLAATVALVGWALIELLLHSAVGLFRRRTA